MQKICQFLSILLVIFFAFPVNALADGIIIPEPPICDPGPCPPWPAPMAQLNIRYHKVSVTIEDQVAVTRVDQVFYNPNDWQVEGTYIFPIPEGAAISSFSLWVDGKPIEGEVLDADQARKRYEEIVRSLQDPALLEYSGSGAWQARIFPILPGEERQVELEYVQTLSADAGLVKYVYPLSTEKFSAQRLESVSISLTIQSQSPLRAVYSPTHEVDVNLDVVNSARVGYEENDVLPDRDFGLYYSTGEAEAFHLLSYRNLDAPEDGSSDVPDSADGFFLAMVAPRPDTPDEILPKDVILVLDRSGSMEGEKFLQAQEALRFILRNLNEADRFNIIAFSTGIETYASSLRQADDASGAETWVNRMSARGNTDINRALLEAASYADEDRPTYLIFLTDGLPTEGVVESDEILANFKEAAGESLRLFAFGVGYDVDTFLLDSLSANHHGASSYVLPGERLDENLSAFYEKISTPVLTDLALEFGDMEVYELYPDPLPDLFVGSQILVLGRYRSSGKVDVVLSGKISGETKTFTFRDQVFAEDSPVGSRTLTALPRLWATRKIGYLLNQIRLQGADEETIAQIVRLSIRYGILTPYTSYLVTEEATLGEEAQDAIAAKQFDELQAMPEAPTFGQEAVQRASDQGAMAGAESIEAPSSEAAKRVRLVGARTFVFTQNSWIDTAFDPDRMETIKVPFLSDDYFRLVAAYPELGQAFALGPLVIAFAGGDIYQVVPADTAGDELPELPKPTEAEEIGQIPSQSQNEEIETPVTEEMQAEDPEESETEEVSAEVSQAGEPEGESNPSGQCLAGLLPLTGALVGLVVWKSRRKVNTSYLTLFIRDTDEHG